MAKAKAKEFSVSYAEVFSVWAVSPQDLDDPVTDYVTEHGDAIGYSVKSPGDVPLNTYFVPQRNAKLTVREFITSGSWLVLAPRDRSDPNCYVHQLKRKREKVKAREHVGSSSADSSTVLRLPYLPPAPAAQRSSAEEISGASYLQLVYTEAEVGVSCPPFFSNFTVSQVMEHERFASQVRYKLEKLGLGPGIELVMRALPDTKQQLKLKFNKSMIIFCHPADVNSQACIWRQVVKADLLEAEEHKDEDDEASTGAHALLQDEEEAKNCLQRGNEEISQSDEKCKQKVEGDSLATLIEQLQRKFDDMERRIEQVEKNAAAATLTMESKFAEQENKIKSLQDQLEALKSNMLEDMEARKKEKEQEKEFWKQLNSKIQVMEADNAGLQAQIDELTQNYAELNTHFKRSKQCGAIMETVSKTAIDIHIRKLLEEFRRKVLARVKENDSDYYSAVEKDEDNVSHRWWNEQVDGQLDRLKKAAGLEKDSLFHMTRFGEGSLQQKGSSDRLSESKEFYARIVCSAGQNRSQLKSIFEYVFGQDPTTVNMGEENYCLLCPKHCAQEI